MSETAVVILAAGEGKRMRSRRPKVLHPLGGRPLIAYPVRSARALGGRVFVVVSRESEELRLAVGGNKAGGDEVGGDEAGSGDIGFVEQKEPRGTGHALLQCRGAIPESAGTILVIPGDSPLLSAETLRRLLTHHEKTGAAATLLTAEVSDPTGYGRVLRDKGQVVAIVEERAAIPEQQKIREIGTSVYCFAPGPLWSALEQVKPDNDQGEYYLTEVIGILARAGRRVEAVTVEDPNECLGINDRKQLARCAQLLRRRTLERLMTAGVSVLDPEITYVDDSVTVGSDSVIYPGVVLEGTTIIGEECVIGLGSYVTGSRVGDRVTLRPYCVLTDSVVEDNATLGPFCHLRPLSHVGPGAKIGNFVELKKSRIGRRSKVPHLSYVGDATVGEDVNVGAGTITCNYDGEEKHETRIGDRAFVGTNSSLVAPVTIGEGAYVGAGSTITEDVPPGALALGRGKQVVKEGWAARRRPKKGSRGEGTAEGN